MANLTDDHIKTVFDLFDADGSGFVDADDLGLAMQALGFGKLSHEDIDAYAAEVVVDGNTRIEFVDFKKLIKAHVAVRDSAQEVAKAFRMFDKAGKGKIDANDLTVISKEIGMNDGTPESEQRTKKLIKEIVREANIALPAAKSSDASSAAAASSSSTDAAAEAVNSQQWSKMMQVAVTDKRRKLDDNAYSLKTRARVAKKGPYGTKVEAGKTYYWCSCGLSKTQPYCDGSHAALNRDQGTNYAPVKYVADENRTVWFCGCKQTKSAPFCDGTHTSL